MYGISGRPIRYIIMDLYLYMNMIYDVDDYNL